MPSSAGTSPLGNTRRGVLLIVAAALTISIQDMIFKLFATNMSLWQIFSLRGLIALILLSAFLLWRSQFVRALRDAVRFWTALRSVLITLCLVAFYTALPFAALSAVGAANYMAPIFVTLLTAFVARERVGAAVWVATAVGFLGMLLLLQPGGADYSPVLLLPLMGAAFYAIGHIVTRMKCRETPLLTMTLSLNLSLLLAGLIMSGMVYLATWAGMSGGHRYVFGVWAAVTLQDWMMLMVLAFFTLLIGVLLAGAYQAATPAVVANFEYSYLVFAGLWDVFVFGETLKRTAILGIILICAAGALAMGRRRTPS